MGLFDTVYLSKAVITDWMLRCQKCSNLPDANVAWQSKALESCMHSYLPAVSAAVSRRVISGAGQKRNEPH